MSEENKPKMSKKKMMAAIVAGIIAFISALTGIDLGGEDNSDEILKRLDAIEAQCVPTGEDRNGKL